MATHIVTTSNWNDPGFWSAISHSTSGHTIDFSALPSSFEVDFWQGGSRIIISDGSTTFTIGDNDYSEALDARLGGLTQLEDFTVIHGSDGDDIMDGGSSDDLIHGGDGNDTLYGDGGNDTVFGDDGNDTLHGWEGNDSLSGGAGNDSLIGDLGNDTLEGGANNDTLKGGAGHDSLDGGAGNDRLEGGSGSDTLRGGTGDDVLTGGGSDDVFVYNPGDGNDTITDFNSGNTGTLDDSDSTNNDFIDLSGFYDSIAELHADYADDNKLNQSNTTGPNAVDYSNNDQFAPGEGITFTGASADSSSFTSENTGVVCFTTGSVIRTPRGDVLIDDLNVGDLVTTMDNGPQRICWISQRHVGHSELLQNDRLYPVLIKKGVMGADRNLLVSRQHGMLLGRDHFARAAHLARTMPGIRVAKGKRQVTYVHLMFEAHQVIFAEGIPSESFYPGAIALDMLTTAARAALQMSFPKLRAAVRSEDILATYGDTARVFLENRKAVVTLLAKDPDPIREDIRKWDVDLAMERYEKERMSGAASTDQFHNGLRHVA